MADSSRVRATSGHPGGAGAPARPATLDRDLELGRSAHRSMRDVLADRLADDAIDPVAPTALPDWTVAHLLTHVARNADSHRRMIEGADRGEVLEQYEGGVVGRTEEIESGVGRSAQELVDDVRASSDALEAAWATTSWIGEGKRTLSQRTEITALPFLRAREVQLHLVDLGVGIGIDDLDPLYVRLEVDRLSMLWCARQPMGMSKLPARALALTPTERLAWLTGRTEVDGLPVAGLF
ncbi:MAG: maleylpyruvate isomerase family mycothiol-dependent enzyme [Actinomycetota bacterium]